MTYTGDRLIHDADAHVMEPATWLDAFDDPEVSRVAREALVHAGGPAEEVLGREANPWPEAPPTPRDVMERRNWEAWGIDDPAQRAAVLDVLGFRSQLIFNSVLSGPLVRAEHRPDLDLAYRLAHAHNEAMTAFCADDPRLLPTCYVPLADLDRAGRAATEALDAGAAALLIAAACPRGHSPSHVALDAVWDQAQDAGVPIVFHVGSGGQLLDPAYLNNGAGPVKDFLGGDENFTSVSYMAIAVPVAQTLATMILDGVLERFPRLKIGVIEQGAVWVPSWMRHLDASVVAFGKHEERLRRLQLAPSEYVRRQVRVTPASVEPVGWIIDQAGPEVCMFSSDYPHVEGSRDPIRRFEASMTGTPADAVERFFSANFADLMGAQLSAVG